MKYVNDQINNQYKSLRRFIINGSWYNQIYNRPENNIFRKRFSNEKQLRIIIILILNYYNPVISFV